MLPSADRLVDLGLPVSRPRPRYRTHVYADLPGLHVRAAPGQQLIVYQAEPGSPSAHALSLLVSVAATRLHEVATPCERAARENQRASGGNWTWAWQSMTPGTSSPPEQSTRERQKRSATPPTTRS